MGTQYRGKFSVRMYRDKQGVAYPDIWVINSPAGLLCEAWGNAGIPGWARKTALTQAHKMAEQVAYDVIFGRIVQAEKAAAHNRMTDGDLS